MENEDSPMENEDSPMKNEDSPMENEDSPMENEDSPKENEDSQGWRQWHILPMTILSADYRCFDLCRLIIADAIISLEPEERKRCLVELFNVEISSKTKKRLSERGLAELKAKYKAAEKCIKEYKRVVTEERILKGRLNSNLYKTGNDRSGSLIQGEDHSEELSGDPCENEQLLNDTAEREYKKFKYIKIQRLADVIKALQKMASRLITIIENKKIYTYTLDIDLKFNQESLNLINKIKTQLEERQVTRGVQYVQSDHIPETTLNAGDIADPCLDQIRTYRNQLAHSSGGELDMKKLYEEETTKSFLRLPYVNFLHCVDFEKYFPTDLLEEKVEYFLYPLATAAEIEEILNNYKKLIDELDSRKREIEQLEDTVKDLNKGEEELGHVKNKLSGLLEELRGKDDLLSRIKDDYEQLEKIRTKDKTLGEQILLSLKTLKRKLEPNQPKEVKECMKSIRRCAKEIEMGTVPPEGDTESDSDTENESDEVVEDDITSAGLHQRMEEDTGPLIRNSDTEGDREEQGESYQILKETPEMVNEGTMLQTEDSEDSEA